MEFQGWTDRATEAPSAIYGRLACDAHVLFRTKDFKLSESDGRGWCARRQRARRGFDDLHYRMGLFATWKTRCAAGFAWIPWAGTWSRCRHRWHGLHRFSLGRPSYAARL